jgi:membrane-bound metal-dependent hydrolase YbcI (DUF457 family)
MMGKTHVVGGCLTAAVMIPVTSDVLGLGFGPLEVAAGVGIASIASMLPDTDHPDSLISHGILPGRKAFGKLSMALGWYLSIPPRLIGRASRTVLSHRGGTHSALFMLGWALLGAPIYAVTTLGIVYVISAVLSALAAIIPSAPTIDLGAFASWLFSHTSEIMPLVMVSIFWGYLAHLFQDSLTQAPVPWLWPFTKRKFFFLPKNLRIKTDSPFENHFVRPALFVLLVAALALNVVIPLATSTYESAQHESQALGHPLPALTSHPPARAHRPSHAPRGPKGP